MFDHSEILRQAEQHESFYLYDEAVILGNIQQLKRSFPGVRFLYSVKCNPYPEVLKSVLGQGLGVDAASLAECVMGRDAGLSPREILYSAPGKTLRDIEGALEIATLIADSADEVYRIQNAAAERNMVAEIGLRINPDFTYGGEGGVASKFGIDEEIVLASMEQWSRLPNIRIVGIHTHLKSQELSAEVLSGYYERMFRLAVRMREAFGGVLKFLNLGSGMGIPFKTTDCPFDTEALGAAAQRLMDLYRTQLPETVVYIETGRYVSGTSGVYATHVVDRKVSHGKTYLLLSNTLNGFARPSMVAMMEHFLGGGAIPAWEPVYTGDHSVQIVPLTKETETEVVTIAGNLCTGTDLVASDITLPKLNVGDVVAFPDAGSYAAVISPMQFASQVKPAQLFRRVDGTVVNTEF